MNDPLRPLGRNTEATMDAWKGICEDIEPMPRFFRGPLPQASLVLRRFRNPRYRNQLIGSCSGEGFASMAETTIATPAEIAEDSPPLPHRNLSALWSYGAGRAYSREQGINFGRSEGGIVSHVLLAAQRWGVLPYDQWPSTTENYRAAAGAGIDRVFDGLVNANVDRAYPVRDCARLTSWESILASLAAGYTVNGGAQWPSSAMTTNADGYFYWQPRRGIEGGHAFEILDYDLTRSRVWIGNSWANWGVGGIGWCDLGSFAASFGRQALESGESEAVVFKEVEGPWQSRIDWGKVFA